METVELHHQNFQQMKPKIGHDCSQLGSLSFQHSNLRAVANPWKQKETNCNGSEVGSEEKHLSRFFHVKTKP
jgi:hypothetical protein